MRFLSDHSLLSERFKLLFLVGNQIKQGLDIKMQAAPQIAAFFIEMKINRFCFDNSIQCFVPGVAVTGVTSILVDHESKLALHITGGEKAAGRGGMGEQVVGSKSSSAGSGRVGFVRASTALPPTPPVS